MLSAIPYGVAVVTMVLVSRHSDRSRERRWHTASCALIGAAALSAISAAGSDLRLALVCISVATAAIFTLQPLFWAITTDFLGGTRAAAGTIAFINSLGLLGGFASPSMNMELKMLRLRQLSQKWKAFSVKCSPGWMQNRINPASDVD